MKDFLSAIPVSFLDIFIDKDKEKYLTRLCQMDNMDSGSVSSYLQAAIPYFGYCDIESAKSGGQSDGLPGD